MPRPKREGLASLEPTTLSRRVCFDVIPDTYVDREMGVLTVTMDPKGVSMHWAHDRTGATWEGSWADLRDLMRSHAELAAERADFEAERDAFREAVREHRGEARVLPLRKEPTR